MEKTDISKMQSNLLFVENYINQLEHQNSKLKKQVKRLENKIFIYKNGVTV